MLSKVSAGVGGGGRGDRCFHIEISNQSGMKTHSSCRERGGGGSDQSTPTIFYTKNIGGFNKGENVGIECLLVNAWLNLSCAYSAGWLGYTDKKMKKLSSYMRISDGIGCKVIYGDGLPNIWGNPQIFNHMWGGRWSMVIYDIGPDPSEFPYIRKILFYFLSVWSLVGSWTLLLLLLKGGPAIFLILTDKVRKIKLEFTRFRTTYSRAKEGTFII
jgi:hypothetical protein